MTRTGALALAACLAVSPACADSPWWITVTRGFDPQILAAEEAYRTVDFSGGAGAGGGGGQRKFRLRVAQLAEIRATRQLDLPKGLTGEISGAATLRHANGVFPDGVGILVDPLKVRSFGYGLDARAALRAPLGIGSVATGAGYSWTRSKDTFEYGILTLYEKRTTTLPYGFVKARAPVFGTSAIAYVEAQTSRLGVSFGLGWEHDF